MAAKTLPEIVAALKVVFDTVPAIDSLSTDEYLPPITTADTALIIPAFGQQSRFGSTNLTGVVDYQCHRFRCELWVKHTGNNASLTQRARAVAAAAMKALMDDPTLGGVVDSIGWFNGDSLDVAIDAEINEQLVTVGSVSFLPVVIMVSVTDFF